MIADHVKELFGGMEGDEEVVGDHYCTNWHYILFQRNLYNETP